jgi:hypothetical protein
MQNVADPTLLEQLSDDEAMPTGENGGVSGGLPDARLEQQRLGMLADYTRFQLGLYTAVSAGVIVLAVWSEFRAWKLIPVFILGLAGLAVGVVASNLLDARGVASFRMTKIKPRLLSALGSTRLPLLRTYHRWKGWRAEVWERVARAGFGLAVLAFVGMALAGAYVPARSVQTAPPPAAAAATPPTPPATVDAQEAIQPPRAAAGSGREVRPARARRAEAGGKTARPAKRARRAATRIPEFDGNQ